MKKNISLVLLLFSVCTLSSCSVVMAAKKNGTDIVKVQQCKSRGQFVARGGKVISSERLPNGDLIEVYQFQKERGSTARAVMHGILDVATWGLWEVVGTPIEGCDKAEFFCVKVTYDSRDSIKNLQLA